MDGSMNWLGESVNWNVMSLNKYWVLKVILG